MKNRLILWAAFCAVLGINLYFRLFPAYFPQLKTSAYQSVLKERYDEISRNTQERFGALPESVQARVTNAQFQEFKRTQGPSLALQAREEYLRLADRFQDKRGQTYLMELDGWSWARYVENVVNSGRPWDERREGKPYDARMLHPDGSDIGWNHFLYYSSAGLYKLCSFFHPVPLHQFLFYIPLLHVAVFLSVLFFFCCRFYGPASAFFACLFVGLAPIYLPRSSAGWFDMDTLNMLLPLLSFICYLYSFGLTGRRKFAWIVFAAFWMALFAYTWPFWFVFALILAAYEGFILLNLAAERLQYKADTSLETRDHLLSFGVFSVVTAVSVLLLCGADPFRYIYGIVSGALHLNDATVTVWPRVLSTVGELKRPDLLAFTRATGDVVLFCLALGAMFVMLLQSQRFRGFKRDSVFLFTIWFMAMFLISFKGVRFIMFLLIPLGITLGWGIEEAFMLAERKRNWAALAGCGVLLMYAGYACIGTGYRSAIAVYPIMNDQWYSVLSLIRQDTPPDAVINSWWDFGDWFKTAGGRRVIFDGQSQEGPRAFWMARVLLTPDENEAVNILRMLNNGGNRAFEILDARLRDPIRALELLKKLVRMTREDARARLREAVPQEDASMVESLIFDTPPHPGYFVVDSTMVMKMPAISFLGNWDAKKVYVASNAGKKNEKEIVEYLASLGVKPDDARRLLLESTITPERDAAAWISRQAYFYGTFRSIQERDGLVFFENGSVFNPVTKSFYFYDVARHMFTSPRSIYFVETAGEMKETVFEGGKTSASAVITKDPQGYQLILMTPQIARSVFFRLDLLMGRGLKHFRPFAAEEGTAKVYEIIWQEEHGKRE